MTEETKEEETQTRRSVVMEREDSRITVSWVSSDNTAKQITWQKDGLLVPVDAEITSVDGVIYVPAAFFETAMRVKVDAMEDGVVVSAPEPSETPANSAEAAGNTGESSGEKESTENN